MKKLYHLVQADGFSFQCFGVKVGVRVNDATWIARVKTYLPPSWDPESASNVGRLYSFVVSFNEARRGRRPYHLLYANLQILARTVNEQDLLETFESDSK